MSDRAAGVWGVGAGQSQTFGVQRNRSQAPNAGYRALPAGLGFYFNLTVPKPQHFPSGIRTLTPHHCTLHAHTLVLILEGLTVKRLGLYGTI